MFFILKGNIMVIDALQSCGKIVSGLNVVKSFSNLLSNIIVNPSNVASNQELQKEMSNVISSTRKVIDDVENHMEIIKTSPTSNSDLQDNINVNA